MHEDPIQYVAAEAMGYMHAAALRAVTLLDIADHLVDGPRDAAELAKLTGTHAPFLRRLLRFTATRGIFHEDPDGRFHLTPYADVLRADAPKTIRAAVLGMTSEMVWLPSGSDLVEAVRSGEPAFDRRWGQPFFRYLLENPDMGAIFNEGMANLTAGEYDQITASYDFPHEGVVVDVGGGRGALLLAVLRANPDLRGVLLDHEMVLADHVLGSLDEGRWDVVAGDFFSAVPAGDLHLVKNILHDWSDQQCVRILENCRAALNPGGRILVIDAVIPPGNQPHYGKLQDMFMLLCLTGQERTRPEFERLLDSAGLRITRVVPTGSPYSLIEAVPRDASVTRPPA